jgi:hypothetical protein
MKIKTGELQIIDQFVLAVRQSGYVVMGEPLIRSVFSSPKLVAFHYSPDNGMVQEVVTWWACINVVSARDFALAVV